MYVFTRFYCNYQWLHRAIQDDWLPRGHWKITWLSKLYSDEIQRWQIILLDVIFLLFLSLSYLNINFFRGFIYIFHFQVHNIERKLWKRPTAFVSLLNVKDQLTLFGKITVVMWGLKRWVKTETSSRFICQIGFKNLMNIIDFEVNNGHPETNCSYIWYGRSPKELISWKKPLDGWKIQFRYTEFKLKEIDYY